MAGKRIIPESKVFIEAELIDQKLVLRGLGKKPSAIFGEGLGFETLGGTEMRLLVLSYGSQGYGLLRPATKEDLK